MNVAAEYVDNESESDTSVMPDLVSCSSSESEYVYSDDDYNTRFHFCDDDEDDPDGVGLLVNEITSEDSDESTSNEYELVEDYQNLLLKSTSTSGEEGISGCLKVRFLLREMTIVLIPMII